MALSLKELNKLRTQEYLKDPAQEDFLHKLNQQLLPFEKQLYKEVDIKHPFIFVFGLPRSGTTFISQLLAHSFDLGYINNFISRFWLTPVTGIRLSRTLLKNKSQPSYKSNYAATIDILDLHEFGYFWRYWLKKELISDFKDLEEKEKEIDWRGLKKTLANIQHEFAKPVIMKNLFGAYHLSKLSELLENVLFIYIERDPLDVAVSILDARGKFYDNLNMWWSTVPPEYEKLIKLDYWEQIAGQVYYLNKFYNEQMNNIPHPEKIIKVTYAQSTSDPNMILKNVQDKCLKLFGYKLKFKNLPKKHFKTKTYPERKNEKQKFKKFIEKFAEKDSILK